jgi:hypothetical protein
VGGHRNGVRVQGYPCPQLVCRDRAPERTLFALCLAYLWIFPFTSVGMAALIGIGTLVMVLLGRRDDIVTTGITTAVVMVVAGMSPLAAWHQSLLRLIDTVVGSQRALHVSGSVRLYFSGLLERLCDDRRCAAP